jgi:hypothetical protein
MKLFTIEHIVKFVNANGECCNCGYSETLVEISKDLKLIYKQNQKIIMNQTEMAEKLDGVTTKLVKIGEESKKTLQAVADLKAELANQENVSPGLQASFDRLEAQATVVDDLVPDPIVEPPIEG